MPRALVLGLGLAVVAFGAAHFLLGDEEPAIVDSPKAADGEVHPGADALPGATPSAAAAHGPGADARAERNRVWLEWSRVQPLADANPIVHVTRSGQPIEAIVDVLARTPSAGDGFRGAAVLRVREGSRETCRRAVATPDGEFAVDLGLERPLEGRVVDAVGAPVEGAVVWFGGSLEQTVPTDADGRFAVATPAGRGVPVVVQKNGKATASAFVDVDAAVGARQDLVLVDGAALVVQAAGAQATLRGARVVLVPPEQPTTAIDAYPFWAQDLFLAVELDGDGRVRCEGLPEGSRVGIALAGPCLPRTGPVEFVVREGGEPVAFPAADASRLRGRVVDERGEPVADADVSVLPASGRSESRGLVPVAVPDRAEARGRTGADGVFELGLPSAREDLVARACANGIRGALPLEAGADAAVRLVLPRRLDAGADFEVGPPVLGVPWAIRVDPWTEERFVELAKDASFTHRAAGPFAGDLRVRTADGNVWSAPRELRGIVVTGSFVLPAESLR